MYPIPPSQNSWRDRRQRSRSERPSPRGRLAGGASVLLTACVEDKRGLMRLMVWLTTLP